MEACLADDLNLKVKFYSITKICKDLLINYNHIYSSEMHFPDTARQLNQLWLADRDVEAHIVSCCAPIRPLHSEDNNPGHESYEPDQSTYKTHHYQLLNSLLTLKFWFLKAFSVEPDGIDSPNEWKAEKSKVEVCLAQVNLLLWCHFGALYIHFDLK